MIFKEIGIGYKKNIKEKIRSRSVSSNIKDSIEDKYI